MENRKKAEYRRNIFVFIAVGILTLVEFFFAFSLENPAVPIMLIALIKSGLIVQFFMHIYRLWRVEEHK